MEKYKVAFIGGSAFSCGGAITYGDQAVILERNIVLAPEFAITLNKTKISEAVTEDGVELYKELLRKGLLKNGIVHLPPVSDILAILMAKKKCNVVLDCEIVSINKKNDVYEILFWACDGLNTIYAENIIDTTERGFMDVGNKYIVKQFLCGAVKGNTKKLNDGENYFFIKGLFDDEIIFVCKIPPRTDYHDARMIFHDEWKKARLNNADLCLISEALKMSYEYVENAGLIVDNNYRWIPSGRYEDIMQAFEEGVRCNL